MIRALRNLAGWVALGFLTGLAGCSQAPEGSTGSAGRPLNVLWIWVDDLRPAGAAFEATDLPAPAIDRLAASGVTFRQAFAQQALCAPSRASVLSGLRPEASRVFGLSDDYRDRHPDLVALPQLFRQAGYRTLALGKVHHGRGQLDDPLAWSEAPWRPDAWQAHIGTPALREQIEQVRQEKRSANSRFDPAFVVATDRSPQGELLPDQQIARRAAEELRGFGAEPFFLTVGFLKPHLPYVAPEQAWRAAEAFEADNPNRWLRDTPAPAGAHGYAFPPVAEPLAYADLAFDGRLSEEEQLRLQIGYRACVLYVDGLIGELLDELERTGHTGDTVVVLCGDHGWHAGEQGHFGKDTLYDQATRVPLIVRVPGAPAGGVCERLVELIDLYPSLAELAGLKTPSHVQATSFVPLLEEPDRPWKTGAFSLVARSGEANRRVLGKTVRTATERFVRWPDGGEERYKLEPGELELRSDLEAPGVERLRALIERGWRAAQPAHRGVDQPRSR